VDQTRPARRLPGPVANTSCVIGTRHWTGQQGAAAVVAAKEHPHEILEWLLAAHQDKKGVQDIAAGLFHWRIVGNPGCWIFLYRLLSILNWKLTFRDEASTTTRMVSADDEGHIQQYTDISWNFPAKQRLTHSHCIDQLTMKCIWSPATISNMSRFTIYQSWVKRYSCNWGE